MLESHKLRKTLEAVRSASALTETTFLHVGQTLEASIGILSGLTSSFETALSDLKGENLSGSLKALAGAAARIAELGRTRPATSLQFDHLQRVADAIAGRISKMYGAVKSVASLVISARIASAAIRKSETDFTTFAGEIARTTDLTRTTLDSFAAELQTLRKRVGSAFAGQLAFEKRQDEAARSIPARLNATVNSIPLQHKRAALAISAVRQRSEQVRQQICTAVVALQAGDVTRQRLEHADQALSVLTEKKPPPADHFAENEERAFTIVTCRLQSAQLSDAAEVFERDIRQIMASLNGLAAESRTLLDLAGSAYGSSGREQGTFIVDLELQVGEALALFADFGASQAEAAGVMASVSDAAESLCEHLRTVQSLEEDIRIMGLNTTLKCARVGPEGRALGLIAQELRTYGNEFAKEAGALMGEVENLTGITRSIGSGDSGSAPLIAAVMHAMKDALATLQQVGQTLGHTMTSLEHDSNRVALLLDETAANACGSDQIGTLLRRAIGDLQEVSPSDELPLADLTPHSEQILDALARNYTMANERVIHERILGRSGAAVSAPAVAAQPELEDMLF